MARHKTLGMVVVLMVVVLVSLTTASHGQLYGGLYGGYGGLYGMGLYGGLYGGGESNLYGVSLRFLDDHGLNASAPGIVPAPLKTQIAPLLGSIPSEPTFCRNPGGGTPLMALNHITVFEVQPVYVGLPII